MSLAPGGSSRMAGQASGSREPPLPKITWETGSVKSVLARNGMGVALSSVIADRPQKPPNGGDKNLRCPENPFPASSPPKLIHRKLPHCPYLHQIKALRCSANAEFAHHCARYSTRPKGATRTSHPTGTSKAPPREDRHVSNICAQRPATGYSPLAPYRHATSPPTLGNRLRYSKHSRITTRIGVRVGEGSGEALAMVAPVAAKSRSLLKCACCCPVEALTSELNSHRLANICRIRR